MPVGPVLNSPPACSKNRRNRCRRESLRVETEGARSRDRLPVGEGPRGVGGAVGAVGAGRENVTPDVPDGEGEGEGISVLRPPRPRPRTVTVVSPPAMRQRRLRPDSRQDCDSRTCR